MCHAQVAYAESVELSLVQLPNTPGKGNSDWDALRGIAEELGINRLIIYNTLDKDCLPCQLDEPVAHESERTGFSCSERHVR